MNARPLFYSLAVALLIGWLGASPASATPQFARRFDLGCTACHSLPPQLNADGLAFAANGYRLPERISKPRPTLPFATWITTRYEDLGPGRADDLFLPKVELISGGTFGSQISYFAEWRVVSLSLRPDGSQQDRAGRFEDLFVQWSPSERHSFKVGQYRSLNQVDVSLRLSPSEPVLFANGLRTGTSPSPRLDGLERFSPSARSPSVGYGYQSLRGSRASDGLFHYLTVPFAGELSIPLGGAADQNASFELGSAKGVFGETFYRQGLKTIGVNAFYSDDAILVTGLGSYDWRDLRVTAGFGVDERDGASSRQRGSLEAEYLVARSDRLRAAAGLRVEEVGEDGQPARYVPYLAFAGPNTRHTFLLQLEHVHQEGNDTFVIDLSALF
jgi:hypothetical protein